MKKYKAILDLEEPLQAEAKKPESEHGDESRKL